MVGAGLSGSFEFVALFIVFIAGFFFFDTGPASGKNDEALEAFAALEEVTADDIASGVGACVELGLGLDGVVKLLTPRLAALRSRHGLALAALQTLQGTGALSLVADWLQGQGVPLDAAAREVLVRGLADQGTSVERWLDGERMSASTYRALVEAAFARKDWRQGKVLLEAMVRAGLYVPAHLATQRQVPMLYSSYEALVKAWARLRDGRAKRSFDEMAARCCVPTDATCLQILAACVPAGNLDVARHVLTYLRRTRKAPVQAFETACATAAEAQAWSACLQIGQDLTADGLVASAELKEILRRAQQHIDSAAIAPVPDTAPRGKGKGKGRGKGSGSLAGFMASVRECGRSKDAARALQLLQELRASGERPDTIACNAVLDVVVKAGNLGAARALLEEMKAARLIDAASFNSMLNARGALRLGAPEGGPAAGRLHLLDPAQGPEGREDRGGGGPRARASGDPHGRARRRRAQRRAPGRHGEAQGRPAPWQGPRSGSLGGHPPDRPRLRDGAARAGAGRLRRRHAH